ncbi:sensory transduction histidine kinase [Methanothermobacter thermautotrophicus str. Delta H]|uniref:Sensory transduction histidine kinase n=1 Tax=Methanothermobacter thermautotrophicus (strain ATCC 29096 / DSM 1053 / JCM 10044 / NBRC 100330 / Delta H) TaxID=187420 RepID=O27328_METTH|nr:PAS domain S-box protein [Methanothermobacter thermautotrophicus]AAB85749.1 sensory transduction histidine kinase [Methanothermobacter thermautotrophicus str. Delta H]WBF05810.1 PAS domain S-box protein [Methanothermobacter thermautotrophicus]
MLEKVFLTEKVHDEKFYEKLVDEIRSSPDYLNLILESSDPWILQDINGFILDLSQSFADMIGYEPDKLRGRYLPSLRAVPLIQKSRLRILLDRMAEEPRGCSGLFEFIDSVGRMVPLELNLRPLEISGQLFVLLTAREASERLREVGEFEERIDELKNTINGLYRQIDRNLQLITSIVNLQFPYIKDKDDYELLRDTQNRLKSIRKAYEKLIYEGSSDTINFGAYARSIVSGILSTYSPEPGRVRLEMYFEDVDMGLDLAVPLGIILSELLSNSFRHAFTEDQDGRIRAVFMDKGDHYMLEVRDNGRGFPEGFDFEEADSLGLQLVRNLINQIEARVDYKLSPGTCFRVRVLKP